MAIRPAVALEEGKKILRDAHSTFTFQCKCGCELFHVDVEIYQDYSWAALIVCVGCKQICTPTEPMTNGPH